MSPFTGCQIGPSNDAAWKALLAEVGEERFGEAVELERRNYAAPARIDRVRERLGLPAMPSAPSAALEAKPRTQLMPRTVLPVKTITAPVVGERRSPPAPPEAPAAVEPEPPASDAAADDAPSAGEGHAIEPDPVPAEPSTAAAAQEPEIWKEVEGISKADVEALKEVITKRQDPKRCKRCKGTQVADQRICADCMPSAKGKKSAAKPRRAKAPAAPQADRLQVVLDLARAVGVQPTFAYVRRGDVLVAAQVLVISEGADRA